MHPPRLMLLVRNQYRHYFGVQSKFHFLYNGTNLVSTAREMIRRLLVPHTISPLERAIKCAN